MCIRDRFGKHLAEGIAKHFQINVSDADRTSMFTGLDIQLDFAMYEDEKENKRKARQLKKKGIKALGGKLFKRTATIKQGVKNKTKENVDGKGIAYPLNSGKNAPGEGKEEEKKGADGMAMQMGEGQKAPRIRRIIGAQVVDKAQMDQIPMLNSSNPDDLQAQLAAFLKQ